ncbi:MAG TPA: tetratricopeptide repeat protein, partial [Planctomycetota bacterium]|nr:tetratricopeptide repeat protein [Planctomycetota bacterium]
MIRRVFLLLDGERSIRDIQDLTRLGQFMLLRAAAHLIRAGAARPVTAPEAFERARARAGKKEWDHALRMARYGLDHERKNLGLLELALRCCESLQDHEGAASYARQVAAAQVETGAIEAAVRTYQKVLTHAPLDLTAHERLFGLLLQLDLKLDALAAGEALAAAYKKMGLPDKALDVYRRLLEKVGDQVELLESVAEIQRHLGDKGEAVALYKKLMDKAVEGGDDNGALDYCRTILRIDGRNAEALDLRQRLESGQVEKARQLRRKTRLWAVGSVLLFLGALAGIYEWRARSQYGAVANLVLDAMSARDHREALRLYDTILEPYRFSVKAREILPQREKVEQDFVKEESERARVLEESGQLPEAIDVLRKTLEMVRPGPLWGATDTKRAKLCARAEEVERDWRKDLAVKKAPDI